MTNSWRRWNKPPPEFLAQCRRLGRARVPVAASRLRSVTADERLALVGDAAHACPPWPDKARTPACWTAARSANCCCKPSAGRPLARTSAAPLQRCAQGDNLAMQTSMDVIKRLFGKPCPPVVVCRSLGMKRRRPHASVKNFSTAMRWVCARPAVLARYIMLAAISA